ncbi:MAG: methyltransferase, partial [Bacteroidota bacterium]|nr:methyltransferase [Bacteroidota bacterium]
MPSNKLRRFGKKLYGLLPFKQTVFTLVRGLITLPEPIYRHLHFKGEFTVKLAEHARFKMHHWGYLIENRLFWQGID